jgi:Ca-activated chloride channel family protein
MKVEGEIPIVSRRGHLRGHRPPVARPGLLEYVGRNLFHARVVPIPARGEKRIRLAYTQVLKAERDLVKYLYPLNTEKFSRDPLQDVSVSVRIDSPSPILNVYSPSHRVSVRRDGERKAQVGYEDRNVRPDKDFVLYYSFTRRGGALLYQLGGEDGRFFLRPRRATPRKGNASSTRTWSWSSTARAA